MSLMFDDVPSQSQSSVMKPAVAVAAAHGDKLGGVQLTRGPSPPSVYSSAFPCSSSSSLSSSSSQVTHSPQVQVGAIGCDMEMDAPVDAVGADHVAQHNFNTAMGIRKHYNIVCVGPTGAGKTSWIQNVSGRSDIRGTQSLDSGTAAHTVYEGIVVETTDPVTGEALLISMTIIDTVGVGNYQSDIQNLTLELKQLLDGRSIDLMLLFVDGASRCFQLLPEHTSYLISHLIALGFKREHFLTIITHADLLDDEAASFKSILGSKLLTELRLCERDDPETFAMLAVTISSQSTKRLSITAATSERAQQDTKKIIRRIENSRTPAFTYNSLEEVKRRKMEFEQLDKEHAKAVEDQHAAMEAQQQLQCQQREQNLLAGEVVASPAAVAMLKLGTMISPARLH